MDINMVTGAGFEPPMRLVVLGLVFLFVQSTHGRARIPYVDVKQDYETLLNAYRMNVSGNTVGLQSVIPNGDQSQPITVYTGMHLYGIMDFDAVGGNIKLIGSMSIEWTDGIRDAAGVNFTGEKDSVFLALDQIWTPNLVLMNDAETVSRIGDPSYLVRFNLTSGYCEWKPRMIINAACTPDMSFYPFDKQTCTLTITSWYRPSTEVVLEVSSDKWDLDDMEPSGVWTVETTEAKAYEKTDQYYVDFTINMKRKPYYLAIVIVLPILLLSLLTGFLFLLPVASGSRVGFGITCFLSFVVILQTLMQFLPESSVPMSLLCVYIITMLMFSAGLSIFNIFIMRIYLCPESQEVPSFFVHFLDVITCRLFKRTWRRVKRACKRGYARFIRPIGVYISKKYHNNRRKFKKWKGPDGYHEHHKRGDYNVKTKLWLPSRLAHSVLPQIELNPTENDIDNEEKGKKRQTLPRKPKNPKRIREISPLQVTWRGIFRPGSLDTKTVVVTEREKRHRRTENINGVIVEEEPEEVEEEDDAAMMTNLTWEFVAKLLDIFFIVSFCGVQTAFTVIFLLPIITQY